LGLAESTGQAEGIYWNNHHHMFHMTDRINGKILWANLHLLFWLSLIPFTTGWMGENHLASIPTAVYGSVLLLSGLAYLILQRAIIKLQGKESRLKAAVGNDAKGKTSAMLYLIAVALSFVDSRISIAIYILVALIWLVPDKRIESRLNAHG
jgi:TMEM175 potassium channel family protein